MSNNVINLSEYRAKKEAEKKDFMRPLGALKDKPAPVIRTVPTGKEIVSELEEFFLLLKNSKVEMAQAPLSEEEVERMEKELNFFESLLSMNNR